ncbi:two-CW domain-containing protein [Chloroflexota bacterium]
MEKREFSQLRHYLGKTQTQMAQLFGVSPQVVHSFEQVWRHIPVYIERQMLLLVYLKTSSKEIYVPCWEIQNCPIKWRDNCTAWKFNAGKLCWFINGTFYKGEHLENWDAKIMLCRQCEVFRRIDLLSEDLSRI